MIAEQIINASVIVLIVLKIHRYAKKLWVILIHTCAIKADILVIAIVIFTLNVKINAVILLITPRLNMTVGNPISVESTVVIVQDHAAI